MKQSVKFLNRPPRIQHVLPGGEFEIPAPPEQENNARQGLLQLLLPLVTIIGYVLVGSLSSSGGSALFILPMALAVVGSTGLSLYTFVQTQREERAKKASYARLLVQLREDITLKHDQQRLFYLYNHPEPEYVLRIDGLQSNNSRFGPRLWERRTTDQDFGTIRIGVGTVPSLASYTLKSGEHGDSSEIKDAQTLADYARYVNDVPITIPLRLTAGAQADKNSDKKDKSADKKEGTPAPAAAGSTHIHTLGIVCQGGKRQLTYNFMASVLTEFAAFHAPSDARIHVIGSSKAAIEWQWLADLPHCSRNKPSDLLRFEQQNASGQGVTDAEVDALLRTIRTDLDRRRIRIAEKSSSDAVLPFLLLVVDLQALPEGSKLKDIETKPAINMIMDDGDRLGAAVIFLVSEPEHMPGQCQAVIELEQAADSTRLRYAEVGINSLRYNNVRADHLDLSSTDTRKRVKEFITNIQDWRVRADSSSALPTTITILEMFRTNTIDELQVMEKWRQSRAKFTTENEHWLRAPIGVTAGSDLRELIVSAEGDGVHGMIAGTTGSGKSEMLLTLILGMAIRYDPSVLNFVLVDYKGGTAFDPMRNMPHTVQIVTNLQGTAGARTFTAIKAEMRARQAKLARYNCPHIANYRFRGHHLKDPFPFLFVIIDEFAEMVKEMPDFKTELDSITRLGRALGVTLILATQRPAGVVTDQMRANIKFRICLRVETPEDSRELLGRSDASFLPNSVSGRAYLQIGNDQLEMVQVGYTGQTYEWANQPASQNGGIYGSIYNTIYDDVSANADNRPREPQKTSDALLSFMHELAERNRREIPVQYCPWPNALPLELPMNYLSKAEAKDDDIRLLSRYILNPQTVDSLRFAPGTDSGDDEGLALSPALTAWLKQQTADPQQWMEKTSEWWQDDSMRTYAGLIDNPANAEQIPLDVDFKRGSVILFGASGSGKTTFIRTVILGLAATHRPDDLNVYVLDFGGRSLELLRSLPHIAPLKTDKSLDPSQVSDNPIIFPNEEERIQRLIRQLNLEMDARKRKLGDGGFNDIAQHNARMIQTGNTAAVMPCILIAIDNFAELKENLEYLLEPLTSLIRDGRANGIYFLITADQRNAMPGKLYNLFTERLALRLSENADYVDVVTKSMPVPVDMPGRGYMLVDRVPLEIQVALTVRLSDEQVEQKLSEGDEIRRVTQLMATAWRQITDAQPDLIDKGPMPVNKLPTLVALPAILDDSMLAVTDEERRTCPVVIGVQDLDLKPIKIDLQKRGPHCVIVGPPESGKTYLLRTWIMSLAAMYTPDDVRMVLIDSTARLFKDETGKPVLADLPHVMKAISEPEQFTWLTQWVETHYRGNQRPPFRTIILIDNYDFFREELNISEDQAGVLARAAKLSGPLGLHFVVAGSMTILRLDSLIKRIWEPRFGIALRSAEAVDTLNARVPFGMRNTEPPIGRAVVIKPGTTDIIQIARPFVDKETEIADYVRQIQTYYPNVQPFDLPPQDTAKDNSRANGNNGNSNGATQRGNGVPMNGDYSAGTDYTINRPANNSSLADSDRIELSLKQQAWVREQLTVQFDMGDMLKHIAPSDLVEYAHEFGLEIPSENELAE